MLEVEHEREAMQLPILTLECVQLQDRSCKLGCNCTGHSFNCLNCISTEVIMARVGENLLHGCGMRAELDESLGCTTFGHKVAGGIVDQHSHLPRPLCCPFQSCNQTQGTAAAMHLTHYVECQKLAPIPVVSCEWQLAAKSQ